MFTGSSVALITPFVDGAVDYSKLEELIELQIKGGTDVILPMGTTGESATVSHAEHAEIIRFVVKTVNGRSTVVAGAGSNCTAEAVEITKRAEADGVDGTLQVSPYYNKPTDKGMALHFSAIADNCEKPIILYSVPGRAGKEISVDTISELSEHERIVALKEAGGSVDRVSRVKAACDITVLSGDDNLTLPMMSVGAEGIISVIANIIPADVKALTVAINDGDYKTARTLHYKMLPLVQAVFWEGNPIGVKGAMHLCGMLNGEMRLPLCPQSENSVSKMAPLLSEYGLI